METDLPNKSIIGFVAVLLVLVATAGPALAGILLPEEFSRNGTKVAVDYPNLAVQTTAAGVATKEGADPKSVAPSLEAQADARITSHLNPYGSATVVLVARNGRILFEKAYGFADIEHHVAATTETKFRIGSVTKQFIASAILRLQDGGKLRITDTLAKFFPDFPRGAEVTLRHMLTHTSGIGDFPPMYAQFMTGPTSPAFVISCIKKFPYDFDPGERWLYSNSGFFLLGDIVEKLSEQPYEDCLREMFFAPLGMASTGVYNNFRPPAGVGVGYMYYDEHFRKSIDRDMSWAGGGRRHVLHGTGPLPLERGGFRRQGSG